MKCGLASLRKNGKRNGKQRYRCDNCKSSFWWKASKKLDYDKMYNDYCFNNRTYNQLAEQYSVTIQTIQIRLDKAIYKPKSSWIRRWYIVMDTTYFWNLWWLMLFRLRDPTKSKNKMGESLLWYWVKSETNNMYRKWITELQGIWVDIIWIVCDWRRWLMWWFGKIPTQMCHFHQKAIVRRRLGKKPKLDAHKELVEIVYLLWKISEVVWYEMIVDRERRYWSWLKEKNSKGWFLHQKARSSVRSLKYHYQYLFIYKKHDGMPNTTNSGEWSFSRLKWKKSIHRGMTLKRRRKFINRYLNWK